MNRRLGILVALVGINGSLNSTSNAYTLLNPGELLEFSISKGGLTRISINNDGIEDIYAYPEIYKDNISHHKSGHIFVVADDLEGPIYLTLITKRGVAQDIKLTPKAKKVEPIILHFENAETRQQQLQETTTTVLKSFVQGIVPFGFYAINTDEVGRESSNHGGLEAIVQKAYQDQEYRVLIFSVNNTGQEKITLDNRLLWKTGDIASVFDRSQLDTNETGYFYVIQHRF